MGTAGGLLPTIPVYKIISPYYLSAHNYFCFVSVLRLLLCCGYYFALKRFFMLFLYRIIFYLVFHSLFTIFVIVNEKYLINVFYTRYYFLALHFRSLPVATIFRAFTFSML